MHSGQHMNCKVCGQIRVLEVQNIVDNIKLAFDPSGPKIRNTDPETSGQIKERADRLHNMATFARSQGHNVNGEYL